MKVRSGLLFSRLYVAELKTMKRELKVAVEVVVQLFKRAVAELKTMKRELKVPA